ncbi:MAG: hypothetical protein ACFE9Q_04470 [Candidatus Hodarchaeota archaeon]
MTRYYFKILILGEPDTIHFYVSRTFGEPGEDQETHFEWYKEIKIFDDICDLEIDAITSISADLDEIIPMADGIIYFLNPIIEEESELFEMILPDIFSLKRDIPTIVMFYDQNGILPVCVNDLLQHIWVNFPRLEAFANLPPNNFHQVLQSLCLAIINGDTPLNIENAWMRFPIFIQMANIYFNNQNYYYAAQAIRKAAQIADVYNKEEFLIICEQAAYLYSKMNLYLEASQILEKVDKRKSINFKKLYAEAIVSEGNRLFNKGKYEEAAISYERAAQWSSIESLDKNLIYEAFKLAINSWISACRVDDALRILESLPHQDVIIILKEISDKIGAAADYLVSINNLELAREQLYIAIKKYQLEALSEELKNLINKLNEVLIILFKHHIKKKKKHAAKTTYDEIENMWTSYRVKKTDLDSTLEELISLFFEVNNFGMATILINKLNSRKLKQQLAKIRDDFEDKYNKLKKKEVEDYINRGVEIIRNFVEAEIEIIVEMNKQKISKADEFVKQKNHLKAANILNKQAEYLKRIGKEDIRDQILTKSLDILLDGLLFDDFFVSFNELSAAMKKKYLTRIFPKYFQKLQELRKVEDFTRKENIYENSIRIYRNQMLYDQSKEISLIFIKVIKSEALRILESEGNLSAIDKAEISVKKVLNIASAYLEKDENVNITFNKIYKKVSEIYIELNDLHLAHVYNDKIENKEFKTEIHKKIEILEAEQSAIRSKKAIETRKSEELKEKGSIIEKRAQEAKIDKDNQMRERKGLKRAYFNEGLTHLKNQQYNKAFEIYKDTTNRLNLIKKYDLAGVSLTVAILILMKQKKFEDIKKLLTETKINLSGLGKSFSDTFAVTLIEYIIDLKILQDDQKFNESLKLLDNIPLFEEEIALFEDFLGEDYLKVEKLEKAEDIEISKESVKEILSREEVGELSKKQVEMDQRFGKIQSKKGDAKRDKERIFKKRKPMRKRYYSPILELLKSQEYEKAAVKYLELANTLSKRKDFETSSLMVNLHGLALLKARKSIIVIKNSINDYLNNLGVNKKLIEETFYVMLILFLIDSKLYNFIDYLPETKEILDILPLFEEENHLIDVQE